MLLDEIANHLSTSVSGLTIGTNLWKLPVPETASSSDIQVSIVEYGGREPLRAMSASLGAPVAETPRFNVAVYGGLEQFEATRSMAESIYQALDFLSNETLGSTRYLQVRALAPPAHIPPDDDNAQHHFTINFEALKERST